MRVSHIKEQIAKLEKELNRWNSRLDLYPKVGDTITHKTEGGKELLTEELFMTLDRYDDWSYYKVVKDK